MTWEEACKYLRTDENDYTSAMAEQIEANRIAIEELKQHEHYQDTDGPRTGKPVKPLI